MGKTFNTLQMPLVLLVTQFKIPVPVTYPKCPRQREDLILGITLFLKESTLLLQSKLYYHRVNFIISITSPLFLIPKNPYPQLCIFKINSAPNRNPSNPYPFSPYAHFPNSFHIIKSVQKFHIFIPFNNIYSLILVVIFKIKSVPNRGKVQDEQGKVSRVKG